MSSGDPTQMMRRRGPGGPGLEIHEPPRLVLRHEEKPLPALERDLRGMMRELGELRCTLEESERAHRSTLRELILKILDAVDVLDCALEQGGAESEPAARALDGLRSVRQLLGRVLEDEGLCRVAPDLGEHFDPHCHRLSDTVCDAERTDGEIVEVTLPGWRWRDEWLRKAAVVVVRNGGPNTSDPSGAE